VSNEVDELYQPIVLVVVLVAMKTLVVKVVLVEPRMVLVVV